MAAFKFLHTADVHLDAPFALSDAAEAKEKREELRKAFAELVKTAADERCDAFLIAGDLFDDDAVTKDTAILLADLFASVPECTFVISPGNHDPYYPRSPYQLLPFPENVRIFSSKQLDFVDLPEKNARIYGCAFTEKTRTDPPLAGFHVDGQRQINLLCLHADFASPLSPYAPLSENDLAASGLTYAALGHIHKASGLCTAGRTFYAYCGCPVGRGFDETGRKSAYLIETDGADVSVKALYPAARRYETAAVDISGASCVRDAADRITAACGAFDEKTALRLILEGVTTPDFSADEAALRALLPHPFFLDVRDETLPLWGAEKLENDATLVGRFYKQLRPALASPDPRKRHIAGEALKYGLKALAGKEL